MTIAAETRSSADFVDLSSRYRADFPILEQMAPDGRPLIYLDHAATSQKPRQVLEALQQYYSCDNANVHRGAHQLSARATDAFEAARSTTAAFVGAASARRLSSPAMPVRPSIWWRAPGVTPTSSRGTKFSSR